MGNASRSTRAITTASVHPHVHGERIRIRRLEFYRRGSSPRAWGTPATGYNSIVQKRFIPTCMGNAVLSSLVPVLMAVHPHVHGERCVLHVDSEVADGSSPRAWGTLACNVCARPLRRFIPTCMGNALGFVSARTLRSVHPHVHGERRDQTGRGSALTGSSPRAWGTPRGLRRPDIRHRFIPTCMGNARARPCRAGPPPVHPHVHGERPLVLPVPG